MNPNCKKNNVDLKIIVSNSTQIRHNRTIDDLINNLMGIVARNVYPLTLSLIDIPSEREPTNPEVTNGLILETVLNGCRAETIRSVILEIASTLRNSVLSGSPQMVVNDSDVDYRSVDENNCGVNIHLCDLTCY